MRTRKLLISGLILFLSVFIAVAAGGALLVYRFLKAPFGYESAPMPSELSQPRVVLGGSLLARSQFLTTNRSGFILETPGSIGSISDIRIGELDPHPGLDVVIAGSSGAIITDRSGVKQSQTL